MRVKLSEVLRTLDRSRGQIFCVDFVKRGDGTLRRMVCRQGVRVFLKGGPPAYNAASRGLLRVVDMHLVQRAVNGEPNLSVYRCIPIEGIRRVTINGKRMEVAS